MKPISYARHRFAPAIIQHAVWLYLGFTLSYRDIEDLLAERWLDISYETVRRWVAKFGPLFARASAPSAAPDRSLAHGRNGRDDRGKRSGSGCR